MQEVSQEERANTDAGLLASPNTLAVKIANKNRYRLAE
jgi:hypothetical protein